MAERATALFNKLSSMPPDDVVNLFANVLSTQFDGLEAHLEKAEQNHEKEKEALQRQIDFLQDENASLRQRLHEAEGRLQADVERAFASLSRVVDFFGTEKMAESPQTLNKEAGGSKQSRKGQTRKVDTLDIISSVDDLPIESP
ncbi:hypothetical protein CVT26_009462 [Gymnopilus dilepis]|uniref:Uncharacterized protein n=1 Tax=Gymnopilus dilepis TaxID=231916 RepID=A0A409YI98_9AGAR|nr:hypothetical protein CVT26_009462 [Gymnopilus dilepis]